MTRARSPFLSSAILAGAVSILAVGQGAAALAQPYSYSHLSSYPSQIEQYGSSGAGSDSSPVSGDGGNALNWAGYVATGGTYTSVSGSWIVPSVADSAENVADATWVGIGGVQTSDLIQAGTEALPGSDGELTYEAWYELLPQDSRTVPLAVSPGDSVSVSITQVGSGQWLISFDDATTGRSYETTVAYDSSLSSADWIEEMPVEVGGVVGLDDFGSVEFTSGYAIENGEPVTIQSSGAQALTMDNAEGQAIATTSGLGGNGSSFSVSRTSAQATPLALTPYGGVRAVAVSSGSSYAVSGGGGYGDYGAGTRGRRGDFGRSRTFVIQF